MAGKNAELFNSIYSFKPYDWVKIAWESSESLTKSNVEYDGQEGNRFKNRNILALVWQRKKKNNHKRETMFKLLDLFKQKYLFFPICEQKHWSVAIVTNPKNAIDKLTSNGLQQVTATCT